MIFMLSRTVPDASFAATHFGCRPRPVQVSAGFSGFRYFGGTVARPSVEEASGALRARRAVPVTARSGKTSARVKPRSRIRASASARQLSSSAAFAWRIFSDNSSCCFSSAANVSCLSDMGSGSNGRALPIHTKSVESCQ